MSFSLFWFVSLLEGWIVEYNRLWGMTYIERNQMCKMGNTTYNINVGLNLPSMRDPNEEYPVYFVGWMVFTWCCPFYGVESTFLPAIGEKDAPSIPTGWWFHPPLKNISHLGWLLPIYGKIKNVANHQPAIVSCSFLFRIGTCDKQSRNNL